MRIFIFISLCCLLNSKPLQALWKGQAAISGDFPATVFFESCTATKIGVKHLLTAAHCINPSHVKEAKITIFFGESFSEAQAFEHHIEKAYIHESYLKSTKTGFDVAIIVLKENLDPQIQTAMVSTKCLKQGDDIILAGHGLTGPGVLEQKLFNGDIVVSSKLDIEDDLHYARTRVSKVEKNRFITAASGDEPSLGRGDSGGAVFAADGQNLTIVGINSEANILSRTSYLARVDAQTNPNIHLWIQSFLKSEHN